MDCHARFAVAARSMASLKDWSGTCSREAASSGGTTRSVGTVRATRRSGGRSTAGRGPTRNRRDRASMAHSRSRAHTSSASSDSSCAHTLLVTRRISVPSCNHTGCARSAMRAPTASHQSLSGMGGRARAKRLSPARERIVSSASGDRRAWRDRLRTAHPAYSNPSPSCPEYQRATALAGRSRARPSGATGSKVAPRRSVVPTRIIPSASSNA